MGVTRRLWACLWLALLWSVAAGSRAEAAAPAAAPADEVARIEALFASWRAAVEASDIPGYLAVLDPEVRMLPPGGPHVDGIDAYGTFLGPVFAAARYVIHIDVPAEIHVVGDAAIAQYEYTIDLIRLDTEVEVAEGALTADSTSARYFDVLRRNAAGEWRVWRHSWQQKAAP